MTDTTHPGAIIAQRRRALGLTQEQLAELIGCHVQTLRVWEQGRRKPAPMHQRLTDLTLDHMEAVKQEGK